MADPKTSPDPRDQEQTVERRPHPQDPTRVETERTSDASTINAGGLGGGRPSGGATVTPERAHYEERSGVESVTGGREPRTKDRAAEGPDDPVLPADDSSLNTKI